MKRKLWMGLIGLIALPFSALMAGSLEMSPESKLWIIGDSTLHAWKSVANKVTCNVNVSAVDEIMAGKMTQLEVNIPVEAMRSGKNQLDRNMLKALKSEENPEIRFRLTNYQVIPSSTSTAGFTIKATGQLTVAGVEKPIEMETIATAVNNGVRFVGTKDLLMTDFGVKPPVIFLIKTNNRVVVHYDLLLNSKN